MGYQVKGARQHHAARLLAYHVKKAQRSLSSLLYHQLVCHVVNVRKAEVGFREGHTCRKVNCV